MRIDRPSLPFLVARAYGVAPARPAPATAPTPPTGAAPDRQPASKIDRLVAGVVPGGVDFHEDGPTVREGVLAMYTRPSQKNAAATGVVAGRVLDTRG